MAETDLLSWFEGVHIGKMDVLGVPNLPRDLMPSTSPAQCLKYDWSRYSHKWLAEDAADMSNHALQKANVQYNIRVYNNKVCREPPTHLLSDEEFGRRDDSWVLRRPQFGLDTA